MVIGINIIQSTFNPILFRITKVHKLSSYCIQILQYFKHILINVIGLKSEILLPINFNLFFYLNNN